MGNRDDMHNAVFCTNPFRDARVRALLGLGLAFGSVACDEGTGGPVVQVAVVTPSLEDPTETGDARELRVQQIEASEIRAPLGSELPPEARTAGSGFSIDVSGSFDVSWPFRALANRVGLEVALQGDSVRWGATPLFSLSETEGFVRVFVAASGSCARLAPANLDVARAHAGVAALGSFVVVVGGEEGSVDDRTPSGAVEVIDMLRGTIRRLSDIQPVGKARAAALDEVRAVVVADDRAFVFDLRRGDQPAALSLHDGAGADSVLVAQADGGGVWIVGPGDLASRVHADSSDGEPSVTEVRLAAARRRPAAVSIGSATILVGGVEGDEPGIEVLDVDARSGRPVAVRLETRREALAILGPDSRVLVVGGVDGVGELRTDTVVLSGCPDACVVEPGPEWTRARVGAAAQGALLIGGVEPSAAAESQPVPIVDEVHFGDRIEVRSFGALAGPRADAAAFLVARGIVGVVGGEDASGPRSDTDICVPSADGA